MKLRPLFPVTLALALAACDRSSNQQAQQLAGERAALEREKAELATQKAAAQQAANEQERARLDAERAALKLDRSKLSSDREAQAAAERNMQLANEREKRLAAERNAAAEAAARQEAEVQAREARMSADEARLDARQSRAAAGQSAEQARAAQTVDFFYDALDPYGDWVQIDRYGYAFRPNAGRDPRWRPYTDGGWVHTEYGWTWRSEEPFGWATYHYGRWARVPRLGWMWIPGTEWGPAWVSWRRGHDYIGWAPLPPEAWSSNGFNAAVDSYYDIGPGLYNFLAVADFGEPTYRGHLIEPEQNVTIINQTTNVTKVLYQKIQNNMTVVNNGPDITVINQASRRPVRQLSVQRVTSGAPQSAKIQGSVLMLVAPLFKNAMPTAHPKAVREQVKAVELEHGWRDAKGDEQRLRDEAKREARRAEDEERAHAKAVAPVTTVAATPAPPAKPLLPPRPRATTIAPKSALPPASTPVPRGATETPVRHPKADSPIVVTPAAKPAVRPPRTVPAGPPQVRPEIAPPAATPVQKPRAVRPERRAVPTVPAQANPIAPKPNEPAAEGARPTAPPPPKGKAPLKQFLAPTPTPAPR